MASASITDASLPHRSRERLAHQDQVGVVGDVAGGGAEVDDVAGGRGGVAEGVDVGHHVVAELALVLVGAGEVDVVEVGAQLLELLGADARRLAVVGEQAESCWASASPSQSRRQVPNLRRGPQRSAISREA